MMGQAKTLKKQLNEVEIGNLLEKESRIVIVKMIQYLGKTTEKMQEMFTKDLQELKNKQIEINNTLEGINSRITEAEGRISDLEDRMVEITATEQNIEKRIKKKKKRRQAKRTATFALSASQKREEGPEKIFEEIIAENFSIMEKEIGNQVQETQRVPGRINPRRNRPRHTVIKLTKIKDRDKILKTTRKKQQISNKETPIRLSADFSTEALQARKEQYNLFKVMKGKNLQPRIL